MTLQEILEVKPVGWDIVRFDETGLTVFKRGNSTLTYSKSRKWRLSSVVKENMEYSSDSFDTAQEAIDSVRKKIEDTRTKMFETLRDLRG